MKTVFVGAKPHIKSLFAHSIFIPLFLDHGRIACILEPANN